MQKKQKIKSKNESKKILILSNKPPFPNHDGGVLAIIAMAKAYIKAGYSVDFAFFETQKHHFDRYLAKKHFPNSVFFDFYIDTSANIIGFMRNLIFSKKPYNYERFYSRDFNIFLEKILQNRYLAVQIEGLYMTHYISLIKNKAIKIIYRSHNIEHLIWKQNADNATNPLYKILYKVLYKRLFCVEKNIINQYDALIAISKEDLDFFVKNGNTKIYSIIPFGVDCDYDESKTDLPNLSKIFFIGSLDWLPNTEGLIWFVNNCYQKIKKSNDLIRLSVAGRNANKKLENFLIKNGVDYHGEVEDSADFMKQNGIMVVPLFSGSGMRVKIIEAMNNFRPIVCTTTAAKGINVSDGEQLIIANTADEFVDAILKLANNHEFATSLAYNAKKYICDYFNNNNIYIKLDKILKLISN